jgi:hypothetical protein
MRETHRSVWSTIQPFHSDTASSQFPIAGFLNPSALPIDNGYFYRFYSPPVSHPRCSLSGLQAFMSGQYSWESLLHRSSMVHP